MIKYILQFTEIKTKLTTALACSYITIVYLLIEGSEQLNILMACLFYVSIITLDMATTGLNSIAGMNNEEKRSKYDEKLIKQMNVLGIGKRGNIVIVLTLVIIGLISGFIVCLNSSIIVLILGALCAMIAFLYSYGPIPIKNTLLGEVASGGAQGILIPMAFVLSQDPKLFITNVSYPNLTLDMYNITIFTIITLISYILISNVMLANNICDIENDAISGRHTLAINLGNEVATKLWSVKYYSIYGIIFVLVLLKVFPIVSLLSLISIVLVRQNIRNFKQEQVKSRTFVMAIKNLVVIMLAVQLSLIIAIFI